MDTFVDSSWYYLRFACAGDDQAMVDERVNYWLPVDQYIGGIEHAILHLLYSRFWHKVLYDRGHVPVAEPFGRLVNQGMILGEMEFTGYKKAGRWIASPSISSAGAGSGASIRSTPTAAVGSARPWR